MSDRFVDAVKSQRLHKPSGQLEYILVEAHNKLDGRDLCYDNSLSNRLPPFNAMLGETALHKCR